jgi:hypothetical protein
LQHLEVPVRVSEGQDGPTADEAVDAHGLAGAVIDELDIRFLDGAEGPNARKSTLAYWMQY